MFVTTIESDWKWGMFGVFNTQGCYSSLAAKLDPFFFTKAGKKQAKAGLSSKAKTGKKQLQTQF